MAKQKDHIALEQALDQYYSAPVPRKEFLVNLEQSLQTEPKVISQSSPRIHRQITFRPAYAFLTVGLILIVSLLVAGPANAFAALQGLIRYIPGFGLVEEKATLRVLAQPVSLTRDGVTITVTQAVLSADQANLTYTVQGLPAAAVPEGVVEEKDHICSSITDLRLANGSRLEQTSVGNGGYNAENQYQYILRFQPVPPEYNQVIWFVPCIPQTLTGKAPGEWEIPLRFAPAPATMTQMPVVEITRTIDPKMKNPASSATMMSPRMGDNPVTLERVIETTDGYIFMGRLWQTLSSHTDFEPAEIVDGAGLLIGYTIPGDLTLYQDEKVAEWAYQVHEKALHWPVTIRYPAARVTCSADPVTFTFDVGSMPTQGQAWKVNRDFSIGPCRTHLDTITRIASGYQLRFSGYAGLEQHTDVAINGQPSNYMAALPSWDVLRVEFDGTPPSGKLTIELTGTMKINGPWQVQWQPKK